MKKNLVIILLILFIANCEEKKKLPRNKVLINPTSEAKLLKIFSYNSKGEVQTIITGLKNVVFRNSKEIWLDQIKVLHIDKENGKKVYIQLKADKGKVNYKTLDCEAWSHAVVIREKEVRIQTDRIFWNHQEKKIYTKDEKDVVIYKRVHPDDPNDLSMVKIIGKNLVGNNTLKTIELDRAITNPSGMAEDDF